MEPIQKLAEVETNLSPEEVAIRLRVLLEARGGSVATTPTGLQARGGSRLALRLLGVYLAPGRSRLPWRTDVAWRAGASGATLVQVSASSDEGLMVARVPKLTAEYAKLVGDIVSSVSTALAAE